MLIPHDFWKVVAFVSERTRELNAITYRMSQSKYLLTGVAADLADFDLAQIPLELVEQRSGLRFASLAGRDIFAGATLETLQPISRIYLQLFASGMKTVFSINSSMDFRQTETR